MKRSFDSAINDDEKLKKIKLEAHEPSPAGEEEENDRHGHGTGIANLDDNLLYEIFKHADARSLAVASCVSKIWNRTATDERLWELICTRQWPHVGCGTRQLRSVVLTLGGFRRLHALYLWPLTKPPPSSPSLSLPPPPPPRLTAALSSMTPPPKSNAKRWGKDEVHVSLSLLSIRYFEKMSYTAGDN